MDDSRDIERALADATERHIGTRPEVWEITHTYEANSWTVRIMYCRELDKWMIKATDEDGNVALSNVENSPTEALHVTHWQNLDS